MLDKLKLIQTILAIVIASGTIIGGSAVFVYDLGYDSGKAEMQDKLDDAESKIKRLSRRLDRCQKETAEKKE